MIRQFNGDCIGVRLVERCPGDKHICFELLIEDDGWWNPSTFNVSSSWIDDTIEVLQAAKTYIEAHAEPDISVLDNRQYGFKFK